MPSLAIACHLSGWTTASASDAQRGGTGITDGMTGSSLAQQSKMAGWVSPIATDGNRGMTPTGTYAETANTAGFQLNPRFSLWLMGFPTSWHDAGLSALRYSRDRVTPSSPK
jgi:hypothetical protein